MLLDAALSVDEPTGTLTLGSCEHHRMQEIAVNAIVECSAQDRIKRTLNTPARAPAEAHAYVPGDFVDLYRHGAGDKHVSFWLGPATPIDASELSHGQATVKWQGLSVRLQDLRPHLALLVFLVSGTGALHLGKGRALDLIRDMLEHMAASHNRTTTSTPYTENNDRTDLQRRVGWLRMVVGFLALTLSGYRSARPGFQP